MRLGLILLGLIGAGPVLAQDDLSAATKWLMGEQIAQACESTGRFESGVYERDLTGDGRRDLILSHDGITCDGAFRRSGFCGAQVCSTLFYVGAADGTLVQVDEVLSLIGAISDDAIPVIEMYSHGGTFYALRWNGSEFGDYSE